MTGSVSFRQEHASRLILEAKKSLAGQDPAGALDSAGRAILHWPDWREPYCVVARVLFLLGDRQAGEAYLRLAQEIARPDEAVPDESLYDIEGFMAEKERCRRLLEQVPEGSLTSPGHNVGEGGDSGHIRLVAGGDVMLGRQMPGWVELRGVGDPFAGVAEVFKAADLSMVNLETGVSTEGDFLDKGGRQPYYYHNHPDMLDVLIQAGIGCLCTGNNHAMDYGVAAIAQQCEILDACGFLHFGAGRDWLQAALPAYALVKGRVVAFVGVETETPYMAAGVDTPGINYASTKNLSRVVAGAIAVARAHADHIIVSPHWGPNWKNVPKPELRDSARIFIDLGADAVLGHSAHVLQGVELHAGRPIVYDMGSLLFDRVSQHNMSDSALFELELGEGGVHGLTIRPLKLAKARAKKAVGDDMARICESLVRLSQDLDPTIRFESHADCLTLPCRPELRFSGAFTRKPPDRCFRPEERPFIPESCRELKSNLVYDHIPAMDCCWPVPVVVNESLEVLGARFASPVHPGRGFVCEVYFRASPPAMPSRIEARLSGIDEEGTVSFTYTHPVSEGVHPPGRWDNREVICDRVLVRPGVELPPGTYRLLWSLHDLHGGIDLPVELEHARLIEGKVYLGDLVVDVDAPMGVAGIAEATRMARLKAAPPPRVGGWQGRADDYWREEAGPWAVAELARHGIRVALSDYAIKRETPYSLVVQLQAGPVSYYFKALERHNQFEPGLAQELARLWPDRIIQPLAVRRDRAWMLMPDHGVPLRRARSGSLDMSVWQGLLARLAELQIDSCHRVGTWLNIGVPDRRLERLPRLLEELLGHDEVLKVGKASGLSREEHEQARALLPYVRECCGFLAREPLSAGLDHGDLHPGNVLDRDGRQFIYDWDTAWVGHPFASLLLLYHGYGGLSDVSGLAKMAKLEEAYLRPWATHTGRSLGSLTKTLRCVVWLAHVVRAVLWEQFPEEVEVNGSETGLSLAAKWLRLWLQRKPLLMEKDVMTEIASMREVSSARPPRLASPGNPMLLDTDTIARVAGGKWDTPPVDALLTGVSFNRKYMAEGTSGNFYFPLNGNVHDHSFTSANVNSVVTAFSLGAVAAVAPRGFEGLPADRPILRVDDDLFAVLEKLGTHVRDHLFTGKRVLVTGTEGKTGFKCMLHHVLAPQISSHAVCNSSNLDFSIYASLASIRRDDRVAILEAAGTHPGRCARRSHIVKPHVFVITEVGNEHIMYHGSQQAVIEGKADISVGAVDGAYGILNADSLNYAAVRKAVLSRRRLPLLTFGSAPGCNGRLLERRFENNAWVVSAEIEGERVEYRLPLLGEHAPLASVSVLLTAYYLGADVARAAADFVDYVPYESQGALRRLSHQGGEVLVYDNATRASVLSYQSALGTAGRLVPPAPAGRKVAVIGEMIFLGDESEAEHARLAEWVDAAGFDKVILVGRHTETTYAHLKDKAAVIRRFPEYDRRHHDKKALQALIDAVLEEIRPGDLLFVKGEVDELGVFLRTRELAPVALQPISSPVSTTPATSASREPDVDNSVLAGLMPIELADLSRYRAAIDQTQRTVWQHYFPFLYLLDRSSASEKIWIDEDSGSICVYRLRERKGEKDLCLFLLPMPMQMPVLERCIERVKAYNRSGRASLFRVDSEDVEIFRGRANTRIVPCPEEYVYAPENYVDLSGNKKRNLRRAIQEIRNREGLEVLDYQSGDAEACKKVMDDWAALQRQKYGGVLYKGFTEKCLEQYDRFPRNDLFGKVIKLDGEIRSFGFAGEMRQGMGNLFITYSDHRIDGLNKFLYYTLLLGMEHLELANASHAGDSEGLAFAKQSLGPVLMHKPYQVYAG